MTILRIVYPGPRIKRCAICGDPTRRDHYSPLRLYPRFSREAAGAVCFECHEMVRVEYKLKKERRKSI